MFRRSRVCASLPRARCAARPRPAYRAVSADLRDLSVGLRVAREPLMTGAAPSMELPLPEAIPPPIPPAALSPISAATALPAATPPPIPAAAFLREARVAHLVNHPGVIDVFGTGSHTGRPYLAMERLEGRSLGAVLESGALPRDTAIEILLELCDVLEVAHAAGVTHG